MALPVRRLTLFQHGLGHFSRAGDAEAEFTIDVPRRAMDDVLKSLTIAADSATVRSVAFETPDDRNPNARRQAMELDADASLSGLVRQFTGRSVELFVGNRRITGELVGLERESDSHLKRALLVVRTGEGVELVGLSGVQRIDLHDAAAASDLAFALEERRSNADRAEARVTLSGPSRVDVSYTAPAPAWRVSYRIIVEIPDSMDRSLNPNLRNVLVQGWGLFDNNLDEDLDGVELTLTAGMPVSFRYQLHEPNTPERPLMKDDRRVVADVFEFGSMAGEQAAAASLERAPMMSMPAPAAAPAGKGRSRQLDAAALIAGAPVQSTGESRGSLFAYHIDEPVSIRRGESGMVPILEVRSIGTRELLFNPRKTPDHPSASVLLAARSWLASRWNLAFGWYQRAATGLRRGAFLYAMAACCARSLMYSRRYTRWRANWRNQPLSLLNTLEPTTPRWYQHQVNRQQQKRDST
jgi:hypothetical protein